MSKKKIIREKTNHHIVKRLMLTVIGLIVAEQAHAYLIDRMDIVWTDGNQHNNIGGAKHESWFSDYSPINELLDSFDSQYSGFPSVSPLDVHGKLVSFVQSVELDKNYKTLGYTPTILELSLISRDGSNIIVDDLPNHLDFSIVSDDNDLGGYRIFISGCNLDDPNHIHWREEISDIRNGPLTVSLPKLNGTYQSEEVIYCLRLTLTDSISDINGDNIVDFKDWAYVASDYGTSIQNPEDQRYLLGDISGPLNVPDMTVNMDDLVEFVQEWLEIK